MHAMTIAMQQVSWRNRKSVKLHRPPILRNMCILVRYGYASREQLKAHGFDSWQIADRPIRDISNTAQGLANHRV